MTLREGSLALHAEAGDRVIRVEDGVEVVWDELTTAYGADVVEVGWAIVTLASDEAWVAYERGWRHLDARLTETGGLGETEGRRNLHQNDVFR